MLVLASPAFEDGQEMAQRHGKKLENTFPPLSIRSTWRIRHRRPHPESTV